MLSSKVQFRQNHGSYQRDQSIKYISELEEELVDIDFLVLTCIDHRLMSLEPFAVSPGKS